VVVVVVVVVVVTVVVVVVVVVVVDQHLAGLSGSNHKNISKNSHSPSQNINLGNHEH